MRLCRSGLDFQAVRNGKDIGIDLISKATRAAPVQVVEHHSVGPRGNLGMIAEIEECRMDMVVSSVVLGLASTVSENLSF